jgi:hypothetical protein
MVGAEMASISMRWRARGANTTTGFGNTWANGVIHNMEARNKHDGPIPFIRSIFEYQIVRINFGVHGAKVR